MIRGILIAVLGIAIVGTGYWGYKEHQEKTQFFFMLKITISGRFMNLPIRWISFMIKSEQHLP